MKKISFLKFWLVLSICYCLIFVSIEFIDYPVSGIKGFLFLCVQWGAMSIAVSGVIGLLCLVRYVAIVCLPILLCVSAVLSYFKVTIGYSLTSAVIELWKVTGIATAYDLISWQLISIFFITLVISIVISYIRYAYVSKVRGINILYYIILYYVMFGVSQIPRCHNAIYARSPFSIYISIRGYINNRIIAQQNRMTFDATEVNCNEECLNVVVVIGESLRSDHLGMNGYMRNTTPNLSKEKNLVKLSNMYSKPYFTHTSVPFMLTRATADSEEIAYTEQSFITLFKKAGFSTIWISNQEDSETYTYFMYEADSLVRNKPGVNLYTFKKHMDEELLQYVDDFMIDNDNCKRLIVLHTIGSHWWYGCHYDACKESNFVPIADSKVISDNTTEQMINSYDNTILATDMFMYKLIDKFRLSNTIIFFQADHGESLGEDGRFLHGIDAPELHYPAAFIWYSDEYNRKNTKAIENLKSNSLKSLNTEYLFHSVVDAADIETEVIDSTRSLLK